IVSARYWWDPREVTSDIVVEMRWFRSLTVTKNYNVSLLERNKFIYGILTTWVVNLRVLKQISYNENEASPDSTNWNQATSERRSDIWLDVKRCVVIENAPKCVVEINTTNRGERCDDFSFMVESSSNRRANYCYSRHSNQDPHENAQGRSAVSEGPFLRRVRRPTAAARNRRRPSLFQTTGKRLKLVVPVEVEG
nr:hypothetical protein [Tanacetum cinerariifolium]